MMQIFVPPVASEKLLFRFASGFITLTRMARPRRTSPTPKKAESYRHPDADLPARPEIGAQAHFKKSKPPTAYRFDSSLAPALEWDGQNPARERAEALIRELAESGLKLAELARQPASKERDESIRNLKSGIRNAESSLRKISGPFLNWAGKAERLSFDVPTLPLFIHERLSTTAILETLKGHKRDKQDNFFDSLYGFQERPLADQLLRAYEYRDNWVNRLMLGDSLVVMNSLLRYESLGGQVQMIYVDPPYGVKFGSNFQPFVRKRDVSHNDDADMTREPEMVQAYRDTWELGLHSYLTYLRDRLLLARELLAPSGSVFVQISDENLHHVREVMDEVFGAENFCSQIIFQKSSGRVSDKVDGVYDILLWYAKDKNLAKFRKLFRARTQDQIDTAYNLVEINGESRPMTDAELDGEVALPVGARRFRPSQVYSQTGGESSTFSFTFKGKTYSAPKSGGWRTSKEGLEKLANENRLIPRGENYLAYKMFADDFPYIQLHNVWSDVLFTSFGSEKLYVVQTSPKVVQRCLLMTTDPGDLVLDPTCGSGTTAFVAEQWGRRWITCDTSRVPLALARQRLLTATFDYYKLKDEQHGPAGGFVYERKQNQKGEEVGGIVPHITLKSIANNEPPAEEVLADRPEVLRNVVRVTGPFSFEATIPTAEGLDTEPETPGIQDEQHETHVQRMLEVLRRAPVLRLPNNQTVTLKNIRPPAKTLTLSAEAMVDKASLTNLADDASKQRSLTRDNDAVAILFGPENGPLSERLVREAWDEAGLKHYTHLYVIGFAIDPKARQFIDSAGKIGIPCTYLQATMDLQMGDLLKNMRSSQIFSVCGLPDVRTTRLKPSKPAKKDAEEQWEVELLGLDTFDPTTMEADHLKAADVPAWFLDTDYNGMVFRVRQAFFPRTGAWENLKKSLKVEFEDTVWDHLAGTTSAPFPAGEHGQIAVKVIDPRGNELLVVKKLEEAK
jgi:adenine-specific DNA-methyltransferase